MPPREESLPLAGLCGERPDGAAVAVLIVPAESVLIVLSKVGLQSPARGKLGTFQQARCPSCSCQLNGPRGTGWFRREGRESLLHPDPRRERKSAQPCGEAGRPRNRHQPQAQAGQRQLLLAIPLACVARGRSGRTRMTPGLRGRQHDEGKVVEQAWETG